RGHEARQRQPSDQVVEFGQPGLDHFLSSTDQKLSDQAQHQQDHGRDDDPGREEPVLPERLGGARAVRSAQDVADGLDEASDGPQSEQTAGPQQPSATFGHDAARDRFDDVAYRWRQRVQYGVD